MANAVAKPTPLELYWAEIMPPSKAEELFRSLPSHIKPSVFERNLLNALMANPELMQFSPALVYREVAKAAALGLFLDPLLGEAYLAVAYSYRSKKQEPQLRIGYKGMIKLARQTGNVTTISCHEVHTLDDVEVDFGYPKMFHHRPKLFTERGSIAGYIATVGFKAGYFDLEPMSVKQCLAIRDRSDAWKAFKEGKIKSTPWHTDEIEMSRKTCLRKLLKRQEQSPELVRANEIEDEAEYAASELPAPQVHRIDVRASQEQITHVEPQPEEKAETVSTAKPEQKPAPVDHIPHMLSIHDPETGEVLSWQAFGAALISGIRTATKEDEIDAWLKFNHSHLTTFKADAPNVYRMLENAINKHREEVTAKQGANREKDS